MIFKLDFLGWWGMQRVLQNKIVKYFKLISNNSPEDAQANVTRVLDYWWRSAKGIREFSEHFQRVVPCSDHFPKISVILTRICVSLFQLYPSVRKYYWINRNDNFFKELTASDFQAWFLVYWASTRLGSSRDNNTNGSLSADVLKVITTSK